MSKQEDRERVEFEEYIRQALAAAPVDPATPTALQALADPEGGLHQAMETVWADDVPVEEALKAAYSRHRIWFGG